MKKEVSLRQMAYMFLFLTVASMIREIPAALTGQAGRSSYISPVWSLVLLVPLTATIMYLIHSFPGRNLYEISGELMGKILAKILIFAYILWLLLQLTARANIYTLTLQFTLMPRTKSSLLLGVMIFMVFYGMLRGVKTMFRFAEFVLGPILLFIAVMFVISIHKIRPDYLLPMAISKLPSTIMAAKQVVSVGGILLFVLFFTDKLDQTQTKKQMKKIWSSVFIYVLMTVLIMVFVIGVSGADLTANLPFPFYITIKSISFFNVVERFEVLVTLICVLSDFIYISVTATVLARCIQWLFGINERGFLFAPLAMIVYYLSYFVSGTQFEHEFLYQKVLVNLDLVFLYLIPFFFGFLCLIRKGTGNHS